VTDNKPTDYAAIIRAANQTIPEPPEWLSAGKYVYSPEYGVREVMAVLGRRLIVKFVEEVKPTQFGDWEEAIALGSIKLSNANLVSSTTFLEENNAAVTTIVEQIQQIPQVVFQSVAQELIASIRAINIKNANQGIIHPLPGDLPAALRLALQNNGITRIYSHQLEALTKLRAGFDLSITTPTASGKTLCYNLAILESCIKQPQTTALYVFPLKALALDQMRKLRSLVKVMPNNRLKLAFMTGDTPIQERQRLFIPNPPNILAVSPDLLHHYLYNVRRRDDGVGWREFLRQLRYCVIDESHTYTGAFGAHFANLMRRLRLAIDAVGGNSERLQFICSSATIGNPQQMALRFSGRNQQPQRLHLIENRGAPHKGRTLLSLVPNSAANVEATKIVISWLQHNLSGIVFCNSRAAVKGLLGLIQRETQRLGLAYLNSKVAVFYSSLTGDRRIEGGRLRLTLVWGEITNSVIGYTLMKRTYGITCKNQRCINYKKPLEGKICSSCRRPLSSAEVTQLQNEIAFSEPYFTKYQAPCIIVELNEPLQKALQVQVNKCKQEIITNNGGEVPEQYQPLWSSSADFTVMHSIQHQIIKAVPLVVLSSSLDVDEVIVQKESKNIGYFFDTCEGGNGAAEAVFSDFPKFAAASYALAAECDCETGCPRCLHSTACPQQNEPLLKDVGLFLLNAIGQAAHSSQNPC
jgi:ATP-dependent helicase YprA (DUF1998 family)